MQTAFNIEKVHVSYRMLLLIQWSVNTSIFFVGHVFFGRLKTYIYILRLFSKYMQTFIVEVPMKHWGTNKSVIYLPYFMKHPNTFHMKHNFPQNLDLKWFISIFDNFIANKFIFIFSLILILTQFIKSRVNMNLISFPDVRRARVAQWVR